MATKLLYIKLGGGSMKSVRGSQKREHILFKMIVVVPVLMLWFQNCSSSKMDFKVDTASLQAAAPICRDMSAYEIIPKLKFAWDHASAQEPLYSQVMSTPVVGDIDGDGIPEIAFTTFKGGSYNSPGYVRVISGANGQEKWSAMKPEHMSFGSMAPLLIDIEGDGKGEVIYLSRAVSGSINMIALNSDGSERWVLNKPSGAMNCDDSLSAADIDNDGIADIVAPGFVVSESKAKIPFIKANLDIVACYNVPVNLQPMSQTAKMSIVNAGGIMNVQGKTISKFSKIGFPAIADIYANHVGSEIVLAGGSSFQVYTSKGVLIVDKTLTEHTNSTCTGAIGGGQATIGDFDGNAQSLEIAIATGRSLTIYDVSGNKIAGSLTTDCSSRKTGVASFDFNGDSKPEIIYADEQYLRIYELDGSLNLKTIWQTINPSGTLSEYPVVADADGDGYADLIVAQNSYSYDLKPESPFYKMNGVRVFGPSVEGSWMPTRAVWNQHNYFITNVTDDLRATSATYSMGQLPKAFKRNTFQDIPEVKCK